MKKTRSIGPVGDDKWQVEDDLRTLQRAEEIKKDPQRMKKCQEMAKEKMTQMACVVAEGAE